MLTLSSHGQGLMGAVLAKPADDAPRLILADWLEEHGQGARATLIRRMVHARTYRFFWRRGAKHGRHIHHDDIEDIRGNFGNGAFPIGWKETVRT